MRKIKKGCEMLHIKKKNILDFEVDAIVNAANKDLKRGGGVCGAIFEAANDENLQKECDGLAPINPGESVITKGYNTKAKYIIHTVGPVYFDGKRNEREILKRAYESALKVAEENNLKTIVFPLISSGIYGYPLEEAAEVAVNTIKNYVEDKDLEVTIAALDDKVVSILKSKN